jgi:cell division septum initiation protein DivIVA
MKMLRFRESFRGYNKDDVNAYIEQINMKFSRKESDLRAQIAELEASALRTSTETVTHDNTTESKLLEEVSSLKTAIDELSAENESLKRRLATAEETSGDSHSEEAEKSKLYDSMSAQVGNILIVANSNAERILADAKEEADRIRREATFYEQNAKAAAEAKSSVMIAELQVKLEAVFAQCVARYGEYVSEAGTRLAEVTESMRERSKELLITADQQMKNIEKQIHEDYTTTETE